MASKTPMNVNIQDDDLTPSGIKANVLNTSTLSSTSTPPVSGNALLVHNPYISRKITGTANNPVTVYQTMPTSGQISSADDPMLVAAPIYARDPFNQVVPLETTYTSAGGNRLKVDSTLTLPSSGILVSSSPRYVPRIISTVTDQTIASANTWTPLSQFDNISHTGSIDIITMSFYDNKFSVRLTIDGVIVYTQNVFELCEDHWLCFNPTEKLSTISNLMCATCDGKRFLDQYDYPIVVNSTITISVLTTNSLLSGRKVLSQFAKLRRAV